MERIKKTNIQKKLELINKDDTYLTSIIKFIRTPKGQQMVNYIDRITTDALIAKYGAPKASHRKQVIQRTNLLKSAMKIAKIKPEFIDKHIVDYTHLLYNKQLKGELKPSKPLTHGEMKNLTKKLNWSVKLDKMGHPIIKTDKDGNQLYYSGSNKPVYKYTPKPKTLGLALKMHLLEDHKMAKWDKIHPKPTEIELKQDLFPNELLSGYRTMRYIHLESVRDFLSDKYCHAVRKVPAFRVFEVYKPLPAQENYCEVERWEDSYCLAGLDRNTSNATLKDKLSEHLKYQQYSPMGNKTVAWKIYDGEGNFRIRVAA